MSYIFTVIQKAESNQVEFRLLAAHTDYSQLHIKQQNLTFSGAINYDGNNIYTSILFQVVLDCLSYFGHIIGHTKNPAYHFFS